MVDSDVALPLLVDELLGLYRALGAAIGHELAEVRPVRRGGPRTWWCAFHGQAHTRDGWNHDAGCAGGPDPRPDTTTPAATIGAALTGTAPTYSTRRRVPTSRPPLDLEALAAQEAIWTAAVDVASDLRHALGHHTVDRWPGALTHLPGLIPALPDGAHGGRWLQIGLGRLAEARDGARRVLDLDPRLTQLGPCPNVREDYPAAWTADGHEATAVWADGRCRRYDVTASSRAIRTAGRTVDIWARAHLVVDLEAGTKSPEGDIRCPACRRRWAGEEGRAELARLMGQVEIREAS